MPWRSPGHAMAAFHLSWFSEPRLGLILALLSALHVLLLHHGEALVTAVGHSDDLLHVRLATLASEALARGESPLDFWVPEWGGGFPVFRHYQHIPHLLVAAIHRLLGGELPVVEVYYPLKWLLLAALPLSVHAALRALGLRPLAAGAAALLTPLLSTEGLYGLDDSSFVWGGYGMFTQLAGAVVFGPSVATLARAVEGRGRITVAASLLALLVLTHTVLAYAAGLTGLMLAVWMREGRLAACLRLGAVGVLAAVAASYFLVPFWRDSQAMNVSFWEKPEKYESHGLATILQWLFAGRLFDSGGLPIVTLLAFGGAVLAWRSGDRPQRRVLILAGIWLLLYAGRRAWGPLCSLLPMAENLHWHRFIVPFHFFGLAVAGLGLAWFLGLSPRRLRATGAVAALALVVAAAVPRWHSRAQNDRWIAATHEAVSRDATDLGRLVERIRASGSARVYSGKPEREGSQVFVGHVPLYGFFYLAGIADVGRLHHALSLLSDSQILFDPESEADRTLFGVAWAVTADAQRPPRGTWEVARFGRFGLHATGSGGFVSLTEEAPLRFLRAREVSHAARRWMADRHHRPRAEACGHVVSGDCRTGFCEAQIEVARPCSVLFRVAYHPGWTARVNGAKGETVLLLPGFAGVPVVQGRHQVTLEYVGDPLKLPLLGAGLALLGLAWIFERLKARRASRPDASSAVVRTTEPTLASSGGRWIRVALVGLTLLAGRGFLSPDLPGGHDAFEYLPRVIEFDRLLRAGELIPTWAPDFNGGYGDPFFLFNPPLFYYLSSLAHALGLSYAEAMNLVVLGLLFACALGMFLLAQSLFGDRALALACAVAFLFSPYLQVEIYVRRALAEFTAFAPLVFALYFLHRGAWARGAIAVALLALSHNPVLLMAAPLLFGWALLVPGRGRALAALALGLGLACFYLFPAFFEARHVQVKALLQGGLNYELHFVAPWQLLWSSWGYGLSVPGTGDGMSFAVGPVHLLGVLCAAIFAWKQHRERRQFLFWVGVFLFAAFMTTSLSAPVWAALPPLQFFAFPWRWLVLVSVATALCCAAVPLLAREAACRRAWALLMELAVLLLGVGRAEPLTFHRVEELDWRPHEIARRDVAVTTLGEYTPSGMVRRPPAPAPTAPWVEAGAADLRVSFWGPRSRQAEIHVRTVFAVVTLPVADFPGWTLYLDGVWVPRWPPQPDGLLRVRVPSGTHRLEARFEATPIRRAGSWVSLTALAAMGVASGVALWRRRRATVVAREKPG
jgi:uncharacterized membrane protein